MALSHAILAVLASRTCSGYDLAKQFDGSVGFFWHATHQQIYRELTKLEENGWINGEIIQQSGRPDKKSFSINAAGTIQLQAWITKPTPASPMKDEFLTKLFVGHLVPIETLLQQIEEQRSLHAENLATYRTIEKLFTNPAELSLQLRCQYLTLRNGIHYETGWLTWCDEAIEQLKKS